MKLTFLGTAAANAYPEPFCSCTNCTRARQHGGRNLRKRSAALINDDLLIDLGPDVLTAAAQHGTPFTRVSQCLQTHAHADHLDPSHFLSRSPGYGVQGAPCLNFYASAASLRVTAQLLERDCAPYSFFDRQSAERLNFKLHPVEAFQTFIAGTYQVTAFPANHDQFVEPLLYALTDGNRTIFYGTDTAELFEEVWRGFQERQFKFDLVILDHTYCPEKHGTDHLTAQKFSAHMARFKAEGLLNDGARFFATHIAHDANPPHDELSVAAAGHNYHIAYDGLTLHL